MKKRPYKMRRRAQSQEQTRQRIVEATAELHGSVGPRNTTISAVAERAGVQRLTVYRHFPDDVSLFQACSAHWLSRNPPPEPGEWQDEPAPAKRTVLALTRVYDYYRRTESMWTFVYRDAELVPAMQAPLDGFHSYLDAIRRDLLDAWHPVGRKPQALAAALGHVLRFTTWASLKTESIGQKQIVALAAGWITKSAEASSQ